LTFANYHETMQHLALRPISLLVLLAAASASQANILVNGSFEQPGYATETTSIPGWTATAGLIEVGTPGAYGVTGQDGTHVVELDAEGNSTIQQTFSLGTATALNVSFLYAARRFSGGSTNDFDVLLNGVVVASLRDLTDNRMRTYTLYGMGVAGTNTIGFAAVGRSDTVGGIIDAVNVSAVPGPVAALPFALMALKRRKRA